MAKTRWLRDVLAQSHEEHGVGSYPAPGLKVKTRGGKQGVVEGMVGGYVLVRFPGGEHPLGYLIEELEVVGG